MVNLNPLKRLTRELAEEVVYEEDGPILRLIELILKDIKSPVTIISNNYELIYLNEESKRLAKEIGIKVNYNEKCYEMQFDRDSPCEFCPVRKSLVSRKVENTKWISPNTNITYMVTTIPLLYNGISGVIQIMNPYNKVNSNGD